MQYSSISENVSILELTFQNQSRGNSRVHSQVRGFFRFFRIQILLSNVQ